VAAGFHGLQRALGVAQMLERPSTDRLAMWSDFRCAKTTELKVRMHLGGYLGGRIQPSQSAQFEKPDVLEPESIPGL